MFHARTMHELNAMGVTIQDLTDDRSTDTVQGTVAQLVLSACASLDGAIQQLKEANNWVKRATESVDFYLEAGRSLNSLGELQATGPQLDVACGRVEAATRDLERILHAYVEIRIAAG